MTEQEWLECTDPQKMLEFLRAKASDRKLRLFAVACCRLPAISRLLARWWNYDLIDAAERFAEDAGSWEEVVRCAGAGPRGRVSRSSFNPRRLPLPNQAERAMLALASEDAWEAAWDAVRWGINLLGLTPCDLLRDIFGNPSHPVRRDTSWLAWNDGAIPKLAQAIYEERAFDRLPILADALEEAGCADAALLDHCRGPGPHVRGCWAVDLLSGKS